MVELLVYTPQETRDINWNKHDLEYNSHSRGDIPQHAYYNLMNKYKIRITNLYSISYEHQTWHFVHHQQA